MVPGSVQVDDMYDDKGDAGKAVGDPGLEVPHGHEISDVAAVDGGERAVARLPVIAAVHQPVGGIRGRLQEPFWRHPDRRRLDGRRRLQRLSAERSKERNERGTSDGVDRGAE